MHYTVTLKSFVVEQRKSTTSFNSVLTTGSLFLELKVKWKDSPQEVEYTYSRTSE